MKTVLHMLMLFALSNTLLPVSECLAAPGDAGEKAQSLSDVAGKEEKAMTRQKQTELRLTIDGQEATVMLDNNPASRDLIAMLPLTLTFEEYNGTEKISSLPRKLNIQGAPSSCKPTVGSFTYYAPWGNLAIFYQDFRHSNGLVPLGRIVSGMELLAGKRGGFAARLELK